MRVLGIETSCDDTGVAVYDDESGLLAHRLASQVAVHAPYGGVVPELAARDHIRSLLPLIDVTLELGESSATQIDGIAYTAGPGLSGALLVGAAVGRSLAWAWGVPTLGVHHMEAHVLASMLEPKSPAFPFLALLVSGGHTLLVDVIGVGSYQVLGASVDDAVGEAFDKTAKLLGLGFPGGPALARAAEHGNPKRFRFPRPMTDRPGLEFSFSGLKTSARQTFAAHRSDSAMVDDIAYAFQDAAVDTLVIKCGRALHQTGRDRLVVAGGVGANLCLRARLAGLANERGVDLYFPRAEFCTDNGAMVAYAGWTRLRRGASDPLGFDVRPRWSLTELTPP